MLFALARPLHRVVGGALPSGGVLLLGELLLATLYFLPSIIGFRKRNAASIVALNFFLGWTFIGWVGALVWALKVDDR